MPPPTSPSDRDPHTCGCCGNPGPPLILASDGAHYCEQCAQTLRRVIGRSTPAEARRRAN